MSLYFQGLMSPGSEDLKLRLELLVECSILSLCAYQKDAASGEPSNKVGSKLVHLSEKVMESSLGVLPTRIFIDLLGVSSTLVPVFGLCKTQNCSVRRWAAEKRPGRGSPEGTGRLRVQGPASRRRRGVPP